MTQYADHHYTPFQRVKDPDDPRRCKGATANGQCPIIAMDGSQFCTFHANHDPKKHSLRQYKLSVYKNRERVGDFAYHDELSSLKEEIGILRTLVEDRLELIKSPNDMIIHASAIESLCTKIKDLLLATQVLEAKANLVLDRGQVVELAQNIVAIVGQYVSDPDVLADVAGEVSKLLGN
jgi:hypothetical protein